jgi:hypothetical protein
MHLLFSEKMHPRADVAYLVRNLKLSQLLLLEPGRCLSLLWTDPDTATFIGPARRYRVSKRGIGATLTKAQAVQTQLDVLADWIAELRENFDNDLNRVIPFEYSAKLAAAMELHGIDNPHTAWTVFSARAEALSDLHDRL